MTHDFARTTDDPADESRELHEVARHRYLNYAMSVVTDRALPDVRDGLKPVQRRVLYAMYRDLSLTSDQGHRKSAAVVGEVLGSYHPHSDQAVYDTMVRMAQDFSLRYPLIDGHGNFGTLDGDPAAASRYTEARLQPIASEMLDDLQFDEVVERSDNYDNTTTEPDVLPTRFPHLLVNGATGIAVGMSTNIPPHNLEEVVDAAIGLLNHPETDRRISTLVRHHVSGPDFPTGAAILDDQSTLTDIYETGSGSITLRAHWRHHPTEQLIIFQDIPYQTTKEDLVDDLKDHVYDDSNALSGVQSVRDESAGDVRIVLQLTRSADLDAILSYLFKHTDLQTRFHVNMTCLVPTQQDGTQLMVPRQLNLKEMLVGFLNFRRQVLIRTLQARRQRLQSRIHVLEGYQTVFDHIDETLSMLTDAADRSEARERLQDRFDLDRDQADAILRRNLYQLAQQARDDLIEELEDKQTRLDDIEATLDDRGRQREVLKEDLQRIKDTYGDDRRTELCDGDAREFEYDEAKFIEHEPAVVIVSRDGWARRQKSYSDLERLRVRDRDEIGWVFESNTRETVLVFTSAGRVYTERVHELPSTSGYGDPIQTHFNFDDGEQIVQVLTSNACPDEPIAIAASRQNRVVGFSLDDYLDPSTSRGRRCMKTPGEDNGMVNLGVVRRDDDFSTHWAISISEQGRVLSCPLEDVNIVKTTSKGRSVFSDWSEGDAILAFGLSDGSRGEGIEVVTNRGGEHTVTHETYGPHTRGNEGDWVIKRGHLESWERRTVEWGPSD